MLGEAKKSEYIFGQKELTVGSETQMEYLNRLIEEVENEKIKCE